MLQASVGGDEREHHAGGAAAAAAAAYPRLFALNISISMAVCAGAALAACGGVTYAACGISVIAFNDIMAKSNRARQLAMCGGGGGIWRRRSQHRSGNK